MSENTNKSLIIIGLCFAAALGPLVVFSVLSFALIASIIGESRLEDPVKGAATPLGGFVIGLPYVIVGSLLIFGVLSLLVEFLTKGKTRLILSFFKWCQKQSIPWAAMSIFAGALMLVGVVVSLFTEDEIGANIGAGLLLVSGIIALGVGLFFKFRRPRT